MRNWLILFCLLWGIGFTSQFQVYDRLEKAKSGDFIVLESNKTITLLVIRTVTDCSLIIEEISAPSPKCKPASWSEWVQKRAPGHTSWSMMEINFKDKEIVEAYSFSRAAWISTSEKDSFLATLLHLPLTPLPNDKLRRIGTPPMNDEVDLRKIWTPPFFMEGKQIKPIFFEAFETLWPQDGSELGNKEIHLYFDRDSLSPLPYWIQIDTGQITATLRAIDSGHGLSISSYRTMPKRVPEFLTTPIKTKTGGLRFSIKTPKYYKDFELFAVDITDVEKEIHQLNHSVTLNKNELVNLEVESDELTLYLKPNHIYTWLVVPTAIGSLYSELTKPFIWVP